MSRNPISENLLSAHLGRREFLAAGGALAFSACRRTRFKQTQVSIRKVANYSREISREVASILVEHKLAVAGKRVVLKPNLVEFDPEKPINTNPIFVAAVAEAFQSLGAADVRIAEGPGHRRATLDMAEAAGYFQTISRFEDRFTDLNLDDVSERPLRNPRSKLRSLYLPNTILGCDLLVSLPKLKTHHWAGATLAMKNLFGVVPGAVYGWPKNVLHWAGIDECIVDLHATVPAHFALVDGIEAMEGNGPIQGASRSAGGVIGGPDLPSVDATCCHLMAIDSKKIGYLREFANRRVQQVGEPIRAVQCAFRLPPNLQNLRLV